MTNDEVDILCDICDMILKTQCHFKEAQNIGIAVLDKYLPYENEVILKLRDIAFYIQSLARRISP